MVGNREKSDVSPESKILLNTSVNNTVSVTVDKAFQPPCVIWLTLVRRSQTHHTSPTLSSLALVTITCSLQLGLTASHTVTNGDEGSLIGVSGMMMQKL